jgi:hypothetical protein
MHFFGPKIFGYLGLELNDGSGFQCISGTVAPVTYYLDDSKNGIQVLLLSDREPIAQNGRFVDVYNCILCFITMACSWSSSHSGPLSLSELLSVSSPLEDCV